MLVNAGSMQSEIREGLTRMDDVGTMERRRQGGSRLQADPQHGRSRSRMTSACLGYEVTGELSGSPW